MPSCDDQPCDQCHTPRSPVLPFPSLQVNCERNFWIPRARDGSNSPSGLRTNQELAFGVQGRRPRRALAPVDVGMTPSSEHVQDEEPFSPFSGVDFPHNLYRTVSNEYRTVSNVYPQMYPSSICVFDTLRYTLDTKPRLWWGLSCVSSSGYRANFGDFCIVHVSYMYRRSIEETVSFSVSFSVSCIS